MAFVRNACLSIAISAALCGCAPSLRHDPPGALYSDLIAANGGIRCTATGDENAEAARSRRVARRFAAVRPWLEQQIGSDEMARIRDAHNEALGDVDFIGCPDENYVVSQNLTVHRILREMSRRQRQAARLKPPSAGLPSDTAPPGTGARSLPR